MTTAKIVMADGWAALYVDGVKVIEDHHVDAQDALRAVGVPVEQLWAQDQIDDDGAFPLLFEDVEPDQ